MNSSESCQEFDDDEVVMNGAFRDPEDLTFVEGLDYPGHMLSGSDSYGGSEDGDYTESDSEGEDSYKVGGYHPVRIGEIYNNRYKIVCKLGWGHFSTVWLAEDAVGTKSTGQLCYVALKIQKSAPHYTEAAYDEIELLTKARNSRNNAQWKIARKSYVMNKLCPQTDSEYTGVVSLCDYFETVGPNGVHVCMVFETMGPNVLTLIKKFDFKGVPLDIIKKLTADCLVGLDYLHRICGIIHTDLKPENVLVTCPLGVPVNKTGEPLIPLKGPIEATGLHFADLPPVGANKKPPIPPSFRNEQGEDRPLTKNQRRKLRRKKKIASMKSSPIASEIQNQESLKKKKTKKKKPKTPKPADEEKSVIWTDPPFVKNQLKPSRSDPSLLSHYSSRMVHGTAKMPYHHPKSLFIKARSIAKEVNSVSSLSTAPSADAVHSRDVAKNPATHRSSPRIVSHETIAQLDIFNHDSVSFKIADLGNACWTDKHFSEDIQTRQYRSPEVLMGSGYDTSADIWSLACMVFELVTGDYLFDPKGSDEYPRDEDHLALIIELLGPIPGTMINKGKRSATFFNRRNELRHIKHLRYWGLCDVLTQKYRLPPKDATDLSNFLALMLQVDSTKRATAQQLLCHPWLSRSDSFPIPPQVDLEAVENEEDEERQSQVILNSPGYSSARSEAI
jgi:serine/threonine-protein kinase SRPK3